MLPGFKFAFSKFYIFLVFAHIILYYKLLQKMINFSNLLIVNEVLALSKTGCHDNTTLVGTVASSSFVLASVFPVVRDILETHVHFDGEVIESMHHSLRHMMENHNLRITDHLGSKIHGSRLLMTICLWNYKNISMKNLDFSII